MVSGGTKAIHEIIVELMRIPNQETQIKVITPFADAMWLTTADDKTICVDSDGIQIYDTDLSQPDEAEIEIPADDWESIIDMLEAV